MRGRAISDNPPAEVENSIGSDLKLLSFAALVALVVQFLKGIRPPSRWVATHFQLDYSQGFIKRGLPGAFFRAVGIPIEDYTTVAVVSTLVTLCAVGGVVLLFRQCRIPRTPRGAGLTLLAGSTYATALMAHLTGYFDHIVIAVTAGLLGFVLLRDEEWAQRAMLPVCLLVGATTLLIHENFLLLGAPAVCLALWLRRKPVATIVFGVAMLAGTLLIMNQGTANRKEVREMRRAHQEITDFKVRHDTYQILRRQTDDNLEIRWKRLKRADPRKMLGSSLVFLSMVLLLAYLTVRRVFTAWRDEVWWLKWGAVALALLASLGALLLHVFGWDFHRFNALSVVAAILTAAVVFRLLPDRPMGRPERWVVTRLGTLLIVANIAAGFGFFGKTRPQPVPYLSHMKALQDIFTGDADFFQEPP